MIRGRGTIFVGVLCALLLSAFAAAGAGAATNGTTAFTCVNKTGEGPQTFKDAHCKESAIGTSGSYGHVAITESTEVSTTNEATAPETTSSLPLIFKWANEKGEPTTLTVAGISGNATLKNALSGEEHYFHLENPAKTTSLKFKGVTTTTPFCKVVGIPGGEETIEWKAMTATTAGQGMQLKFSPVEGTVLAEFELVNDKGECTAVKGVQKVIGSFKLNPTGATLETTYSKMVTEATLRLGSATGFKVGMEGLITVSGRANKEGAYAPLSPTTVETPKVVKGTTASTCKLKASEGGAGFSKEHCKPADAVASGAKYEHASIAESTKTETRVSNATTGAESPELLRLKATVGGTAVEVTAASVSGEGTMENKKDASGEHYISGEGSLTLTEAKVTSPADKGCRVYTAVSPTEMGEEGKVDSQPLTLTSTGQGDALKISPKEGSALAKFWIAGCGAPYEALNKTWQVEGSVWGTPEGATLKLEEGITTGAGLTVGGGVKAGLSGKLTLSGRANNKEGFTALSPTTVET
ncbi:MAG TPA: hypothetical protein VFJ57_01440 [Solirubrobacterales bacterium]|nr:hypothetical protein [Solirubrobacterales bacterium]